MKPETLKIGKARGLFSIHDGVLEVHSVRVPRVARGKGEAKRLLAALVERADADCLDMQLVASPLDKKTGTAGLVRLYGGFGFKPTGQRANPLGDPWMRRVSPCKRRS